MKGLVKGVVTVAIGGVLFSVSQADVAENLSKETGLSQQEAEQYIQNIPENEQADTFGEIGLSYVSDGQETLSMASEIDCINYYYEWETDSISCNEGKSQLTKFANDEIALGKAYNKLDVESASTQDIPSVIRLIDIFNSDFSLPVIIKFLDYQTRNEFTTTNSYNKAVLQSIQDSN